MKHIKRNSLLAVAGLTALSAAAPIASQARNPLSGILLGGGVAVAVSKFGPQINDFMNKLTGNKDGEAGEYTKVVPIISAGAGTYLGAVQVAGPRAEIDRTKAVAQLEGRFSSFRVKALIPVDNLNPTKKPSRVRNVGVTGLVDIKL
ncbi:MAG TPA: hypothetical protein VGM37_00710 [Armatimonadota bacterium]|jgi:hypothetical protein